MSLSVTFRGLASKPEVNRRAEKHYEKLERFMDPAGDAALVLNAEHGGVAAELVVNAWSQTFKAEAQNGDLKTALDMVMHTMEEQLRRHKDRRTNKRGSSEEREDGMPPE